MKVSVVVIGFGLVVFGRTILGLLRATYLKQASENISIDPSKEIVLRHEIWDYIFPTLMFGLSLMFGFGAYKGSPYPEAILIYKITSAISFLGGVFLLYLELTGRVTIFNGKLIYRQGPDRWIVHADEVLRVWMNGFSILVKLRSEKVVRIPATFEHSEIILAFLKQAAVNKE